MLRCNKTTLGTGSSPLWCGLAAGWCERFAGVVQHEDQRPALSRRFFRYAEIAGKTAYAGMPRYVQYGQKKTARSFARLESTEVVEETDSTIYHLLRRNKSTAIT
ncbi:hypothetical protein M1D55_01390 [Cupriavidus sp. JZ107]